MASGDEEGAAEDRPHEDPNQVVEQLFEAINDSDVHTAWMCLDANAGTVWQIPVDVVDSDGNTPLSDAACYGEVEIVQLLLSRRAHPDVQNAQGRTPLWRACYNGQLEVVNMLLESGADKTITNKVGESAGAFGSAATKAAVAAWDMAKTAELRRSLGLDRRKAVPQSWGKKAAAKEVEAGENGELVLNKDEWPLRIKLIHLATALEWSHSCGRVPLVVCNGDDGPERFLLYTGKVIIDAQELLNEVYATKTKSVEAAQDELSMKLLAAMETYGHGLALHIRMSNTACNFKNIFCCTGKFPVEVFGGPRLWNNDISRTHFDDPNIMIQPEFRLVLSTAFSLDEARQHFPDAVPYFDDMAVIDVVEDP